MAPEHLENDERQAMLTILLAAIVSVIAVGSITAMVLSTKACTV